MPIAFNAAPFKTSGGTASRSLDAWFSDVINVAEFADLHTGGGSFGVYHTTANDALCFQRAFDLAFHNYGGTPGATPTGVPHGLDYAHLNRPVFIPNGVYRLAQTLSLNKVVGGHIFAAGKQATRIQYEPSGAVGALKPTIDMNGCSDLCIEKMSLVNSGNGGSYKDTNTCVLNIDWDGDDTGNGCDGNHGNHFLDLAIGGGDFGVVIGSDATSEGHNMLFTNCTLGANSGANSGRYGYDIRGPNAWGTAIGGGVPYHFYAGVRCPSGGGAFYSQGLSNTGNPVDYIMESDKVMFIGQQRTESAGVLRMENGVVTVEAVTGSTGLVTAVVINGGTCNLLGSLLNDLGQVSGTGGQLLLWGNYFGTSVTPLSGYSGTVVWNPQGIT